MLQGLFHEATDQCGDVCLCNGGLGTEPSCLSASPGKVLKVFDLGQANEDNEDEVTFMKQVKHFLAKMSKLEDLVV